MLLLSFNWTNVYYKGVFFKIDFMTNLCDADHLFSFVNSPIYHINTKRYESEGVLLLFYYIITFFRHCH